MSYTQSGVSKQLPDEEQGRYNFERWRIAFFDSYFRARGVQAG
jgi:hypothetical protein